MITQSELKEQLNYDSETGIFTRLISNHKKYKIGDIAGYLNKRGYVSIRLNSISYRAHRLAWLYMTGKFPIYDIDHINGIKNDNRLVNLRDIEHFKNCQNLLKPKTNNTTGYLGVSKNKNGYVSFISVKNKPIYLGSFSSKEEASSAYMKARREMQAGNTL